MRSGTSNEEPPGSSKATTPPATVGTFRSVQPLVRAMFTKLLRVAYAATMLKGLLAALAPRQALKAVFATWRPALKNTGELEPREWYVTAVRAAGVGMLAAGGVGLLLTADDEESEMETDGETDAEEPVDISLDEE